MNKIVKIASLVLALAFGFSLVACNKVTTATNATTAAPTVEPETDYPDSDYVNADMSFVKQNVKGGTISKGLDLPTEGVNGSTVSWVSSDETVIKSDGSLPEVTNGGLTADGSLPTATITGTVTYGSASDTYTVEVTVDRTTEDADAVVVAIAALENQYMSKTLSGFKISKDSAGKMSYSLEFLTRDSETVAYTSSDHLRFEGSTAYITFPTSEECGDKAYITENLLVAVTRKDVTVNVAIPLQIEPQDAVQFVTVSELRNLMAQDGWASANASKTKYCVSGTVSLVWELTSSYEGFYMQDGGCGLYIYSASIGTSIEAVAEGDEVFVTTTVTLYNDTLAETSSVSAVQVYTKAEDNAERIAEMTPYAITADSFVAEKMAMKDGIVASADELIFISGSMTSGTSANNLVFRIPGTTTNITATCGKYTSDFKDIMTFINGLKPGDLVKFEKVAIGRYKKNFQLTLTNAEYLSKLDATLSDVDKVNLETELTEFDVPTAALSGLSYKLPSGQFGTTITWALKEANDKVTIADGKITMGTFDENFEFVLIPTITSGEVSKTGKEYTVNAVKLDEFADILAAVDAGTFTNKMTTRVYVVDTLGGNKGIVTADYKTFAIANMVSPSSGTQVIIDVTKALKNEYGQYEITAGELVNTVVGGIYLGTTTLSLDLNKKCMTNVTVAEDGTTSAGDAIITFYTDSTLATKLAAGTYEFIYGYVYSYATEGESTKVNVVVTSSTDVSIKTANATDTSSKTVVSFSGLVVAIMNSGSVYVADANGDVTCVYIADTTLRKKVSENTYISVVGTVSARYSLVQIASVTSVENVIGTLDYTIDTIAANVTQEYNPSNISATLGHVTLNVLTGTYDAESTEDSDNSYENLYIDMTDGTNVKCLNNSSYFKQADAYAAAKAKITAAITGGTAAPKIRMIVVDNIYTSSGSTVCQAYPIWETLTIVTE